MRSDRIDGLTLTGSLWFSWWRCELETGVFGFRHRQMQQVFQKGVRGPTGSY